MKYFFSQINKLFSEFSRLTLVILSVGLILLVGLIRYNTGTEYALSLFFLFPIVLSTWYVGRGAGIIMSILSIIAWLIADLYLLSEFSDSRIPFINETFRLIVFLFVTYLVWGVKTALEAQKNLARTDPLTGIANRRFFFEFVEIELKKAQRFKDNVSIIYMDIDDFKIVNDNLGHQIGDNLLKVVAETITKNIRAIDIAARFGGDEFGIFLSKTNDEGARSLAEKIQKRLLDRMRHHHWTTTFSIGVVTFQNCNVRVYEMLHIADKLMYFAKRNGKNRIACQLIIEKSEEALADIEVIL
ncbi:MAG: diguanylate cyclase [Desulfobacteraceae bacterium]|nr:diguanylate cyclase [Desulfobacteraceae bacterium]MBC2756130.1 diguanylate cyclase [Desulfobacteraceae bacterium]